MGYYTRHRLIITQLTQEDLPSITFESVIDNIKNNSVDQEEVVNQLKRLQDNIEGKVIKINENTILEDLRDSNEEAAYALEEDGSPSDAVKWYDHRKDLGLFSKKYPNWLFKLEGEGEESGDLWIEYFHDGKMQVAKAQIIYEEFNMAKLTKI